MICLWPAMTSSADGVGFSRACPMSLIPSMKTTCVTPGCAATLCSKRASALMPDWKFASLSTRLPAMPAFMTPIRSGVVCDSIRRTR